MQMPKKPENNPCLNGIRTYDSLRDAGSVLWQLSYETNWELVTF